MDLTLFAVAKLSMLTYMFLIGNTKGISIIAPRIATSSIIPMVVENSHEV